MTQGVIFLLQFGSCTYDGIDLWGFFPVIYSIQDTRFSIIILKHRLASCVSITYDAWIHTRVYAFYVITRYIFGSIYIMYSRIFIILDPILNIHSPIYGHDN